MSARLKRREVDTHLAVVEEASFFAVRGIRGVSKRRGGRTAGN
jgi:hypothetical protein